MSLPSALCIGPLDAPVPVAPLRPDPPLAVPVVEDRFIRGCAFASLFGSCAWIVIAAAAHFL